LEHFKTTTVILGVIAIAQSRIETVEQISDRLQAALKHIDADRLIAAPDCGLGFLNRKLALAKLANMVTAAKGLGKT
jgi:5-methyltetrahydropteroyltriglutamate--homocysteine methyltransferase